MPVWSLPGFTPPRFVADCEAAGIGQTLLTPWMARPDAVSVAFLDSLARTGPAQAVLGHHSDLLCKRLAEEPQAGGKVRSPDPRTDADELRTQATLVCALHGQLADIATAIDTGRRPPSPAAAPTCAAQPRRGGTLAVHTGTTSVPQRTTRTTGVPQRTTRTTGVPHRTARTSGVPHRTTRTTGIPHRTIRTAPGAGGCELPMWRLEAVASRRSSPLTVCSDGVTTEVANGSPSIAFFYEGGKPPVATLGAVPGQVVIVPNLEKIVLAILADAGKGVVNLVKAGGCAALDLVGVVFPPCQDPGAFSESQVLKLFQILRPGGSRIRTAPSYYSVAWGDETGLPAGVDLGRPRTYSRALTFLNYAVLPVLGLFLNRDVVLDLSSIERREKQVVLDQIAAHISAPPPGQGNDLEFVARLAGTILTNPQLLANLVVVFMPSLIAEAPDAIRWVRKALGYLKKLPVLGYIDAAFTVVGYVSNAAEVVISLVHLLRVGSYPAYVSWPAYMTLTQAKALPAGTCAPPHGLAPPVGAPGSLTCLLAVDADLDGDRAPDRLVMWSAGGAPVGGTAFLPGGHIRVWAPDAPSLPGGLPLSAVADRLNDSPRRQVGVTAGGTSMLVSLNDHGTLQAIRYGDGHNRGRLFLIPPAGAEHHTGCVEERTGRLLVTTISRPARPSGTREASFYYALRTSDLTLRLVGYSGAYTATPGGFAGDDCAKDRLPAATIPSGMARDTGGPLHHDQQAALAVDGLFDAANAGRTTRAAAFLGGTEPVPPFPGYSLGVWTLLRADPAALAEAARTPAACATRVPRHTHPFLYCRIQTARQAWDLQVSSTGDNYVVVAAAHRTW
ncbi:hypothetical protein [Sphaerisporangium aureirubrum]|uniref:Uncharacterized protein n=1 Tax=Sphaerisporangium aureirubrum TaxID=1544736 RepID=A0ABW1NUF5_9ACTN